VSCPNTVSSRVIHLVFHRLQHNYFSSLDSINMVYQHPYERLSAATDTRSRNANPVLWSKTSAALRMITLIKGNKKHVKSLDLNTRFATRCQTMKLIMEYYTAVICFGCYIVSLVYVSDTNSDLIIIGHIFCRRCIRR
jgi:hypothetical protein